MLSDSTQPGTVTPQARLWLSLSLLPGWGPKRLASLKESFQDSPLFGEQENQAHLEALLTAESNATQRAALLESVLQKAQAANITIRSWGESAFPEPLRQAEDSPPLLYSQGKLHPLAPALAIVGTRSASPRGQAFAAKIAGDMARHGWVIVSGLARGIDQAAHRGCLDAGGRTLAVLGSGLCKVYPRDAIPLAQEIAKQGALLSEYPMDWGPRPWTFLRRNRWIAALSQAVLVVECPARSGALGTAKWARKSSRKLLVVPGPIGHSAWEGSRRLLEQGARPVESAEDVLMALGQPMVSSPESLQSAPLPKELSRPALQVLELMDFLPLSASDLAQRSGLSLKAVRIALAELEVHQLVKGQAGPVYSRIV